MELAYPVDEGAPITQKFGENPAAYRRFNLAGHNGIDFGLPLSQPVRATADGKVASVSSDPQGYGLHVRIEHQQAQQRFLAIYAHLSLVKVHAGEAVVTGQVIGMSGNSGNSSAPHLHFEIRPAQGGMPGFNGAVDPLPYLRRSMLAVDTLKKSDVLGGASNGVVQVEALRVRRGPGTQYAHIGWLRAGDLIQIECIQDGWAKLISPEQRWCFTGDGCVKLFAAVAATKGEESLLEWARALDAWARTQGYSGQGVV